ncbi:MAG: hypothetical protein GXP61_00480 [Epsilonproteobacteria bacterium]|nr:hypothetical protein [Campylobacterota bacterium]
MLKLDCDPDYDVDDIEYQQNIWEGGCERDNEDNNSVIENYPCSYVKRKDKIQRDRRESKKCI